MALTLKEKEQQMLAAAEEMGKLVVEKNRSYGDSVNLSTVFFTNLYPNGIPVEQYRNILIIARILDKLSRLATDPNAFNEDAWKDIIGYGIRGAVKD
jgi:hypothetical protein